MTATWDSTGMIGTGGLVTAELMNQYVRGNVDAIEGGELEPAYLQGYNYGLLETVSVEVELVYKAYYERLDWRAKKLFDKGFAKARTAT